MSQETANVGQESGSFTVSFSPRLLNVLEVVAPFKHFNKLREFVQMKLPPGFPVKLGTPVCARCPVDVIAFVCVVSSAN